MRKEIKKILVIILVSVLMTSCFVAKTYERPEIETEDLYRNFKESDSLTIGTIEWKDFFKDKHLQKLIDSALHNNFDIKIALENVLAAEAYYNQGRSGYLPELTVNANGSFSFISKNGQNSFLSSSGALFEQFELSGSVSWEADIWGKIRSNRRATFASFLASNAGYRLVKTKLISSIASSYYQLLAFDAQLKVTEQSLENRKQNLETMRVLKEAGEQTEVAVLQSEAQVYEAEVMLFELTKNIQLLENTLSILLGKRPQEIERGTLNNQEIPTDLKIGYPAQLLRNRPDVVQAEYQLVQMFEMENVSRANFYPSFTISATGGFQSLEFDTWFDVNSLFVNMVAGLAQPVFNQRKIKAQYEVSQAQRRQALYNYKLTILTAGKEVSDALLEYEIESEKLILLEKEVEVLNKATEYSEELLIYGLANYLEVLTSNNLMLTAELNKINTEYQKINAIITLYQALGGGSL
ncbi:efflux transporter outer membrane subunit [Aureivirga marina]|uniref:efflux transporter outer membrane subunit n=1 Tax=Aureivirga marina TaxID=1182451 RepID=UPI0018CB72B1|nr:efflux transporter outer membrane subunit [Aureivirga marina]